MKVVPVQQCSLDGLMHHKCGVELDRVKAEEQRIERPQEDVSFFQSHSAAPA